MSFQPKVILVTGGAGFIGCNYVRYILKTDPTVQIVNLDNLTYAGSLDNLRDISEHHQYTFVKGDICNRELVSQLLRDHEIDTIVHFAAESHVDRSIIGPATFIETNIVGTFTLLDVARQYWLESKQWDYNNCRFHHISTDEVYGTLGPNDEPFQENTPYAPNSPYSASKAGSDHLVRSYFHTYGLPVTTSNCSNNYGPFQHKEKFVPTIIRHCIEYKNIPVYGEGLNIRDWLYVDDHCCGIDMVIRNGKLGEVYNLGGDNEWINIELVRLICKIMDEKNISRGPHEKLITFVDDRPGHDLRYAINASKVKREIGWQLKRTFESAMKLTIDWVISNSIK